MAILQNSQISGKLTISGSRDATVTLPSYTNTERDALSANAGDIVFNESNAKTQFYTGNAWADAVGRQGAQGAQGYQGLHGTPGGQGATGDAGAQGATGAKGPAGPQGYHGAVGYQGATGPTGDRGPQGPTGATGYTGYHGNTNNTKGTTGPKGAKGPKGADGYQGYTGATPGPGPTGGQGPRSGPKGAKGDTGYTGYHGNTNTQAGATGPTGPKGPKGTAGYTGYMGSAGPTGPPGWPYQSMNSNSTPTFSAAMVAHNSQTSAHRLWASSHYAVNHSELYNTNNYGMNHRGNSATMTLINKNNQTAGSFYSTGNIFMDGSRWSDERAKTNIEAYTGSATEPSASVSERLSTIKPKKFRFNNTPSTKPITVGLIAQDVKIKFPELVNAKNDGTGSAAEPEMMGINYTGLRAVLYEAVKELKTELSGITNRVTTLESA